MVRQMSKCHLGLLYHPRILNGVPSVLPHILSLTRTFQSQPATYSLGQLLDFIKKKVQEKECPGVMLGRYPRMPGARPCFLVELGRVALLPSIENKETQQASCFAAQKIMSTRPDSSVQP